MHDPDLTFAIGDLHGRFDLLKTALTQIEHRGPDGGGSRRIVILGDTIDRGPQSRQILETLAAGPPPGWIWHILMGNHEAMMRDACARHGSLYDWLDNGGDATLRSFGPDALNSRALHDAVAFAAGWPLWYADRHRLFVHAGAYSDLPLERQGESVLLWGRDTGTGPHQGRHIVHGHTPQTTGKPLLLRHRTNLDTFAVKTGRLAVGVFDDALPGGPIDIIEVAGGALREF